MWSENVRCSYETKIPHGGLHTRQPGVSWYTSYIPCNLVLRLKLFLQPPTLLSPAHNHDCPPTRYLPHQPRTGAKKMAHDHIDEELHIHRRWKTTNVSQTRKQMKNNSVSVGAPATILHGVLLGNTALGCMNGRLRSASNRVLYYAALRHWFLDKASLLLVSTRDDPCKRHCLMCRSSQIHLVLPYNTTCVV